MPEPGSTIEYLSPAERRQQKAEEYLKTYCVLDSDGEVDQTVSADAHIMRAYYLHWRGDFLDINIHTLKEIVVRLGMGRDESEPPWRSESDYLRLKRAVIYFKKWYE